MKYHCLAPCHLYQLEMLLYPEQAHMQRLAAEGLATSLHRNTLL